MTLQKALRPGSCNRPAYLIQTRSTGARRYFCASQTLRTDKSCSPRVAGMPNQNEFGQTRHDDAAPDRCIHEKPEYHRVEFRKFTMKLARMQLIVNLLPGGIVKACS